MTSRLSTLTCLAVFAVATRVASADVKLNNMFTDGCVLQSGREIPVWGWAADGEEVSVSLGGLTKSTIASGGRWSVRLKPMKPGGPYVMGVRGKNTVWVRDVLIGEVWICSGQSNMQWSVVASTDGDKTIASAGDPLLRLITVPRQATDEPLDNINAKWQLDQPANVKDFSAVAYFFGRYLRKSLGVPVGLVSTNYGGTPAEAWTRRDILEQKYPKLISAHQTAISNYVNTLADTSRPIAQRKPSDPRSSPQRPYGLYNAMIAPILPYGIAGAIWYQGESNAGRAWEYRTLFPDMIKNWREDWHQGDFPFLFVQLAPFMKIVQEPVESAWAELREAQLYTLQTLPKTGMAVITDVGEENDIHPKHKREVGERLALWAEAIAYGRKVTRSGPIYDRMSARDGAIHLWFNYTDGGLHASGGITGFTIAGADRKFYNAEARIEGNRVVVSSSFVPNPVAVRFGWANYPLVNITNGAGLPMTPFRTDRWPVSTQPK